MTGVSKFAGRESGATVECLNPTPIMVTDRIPTGPLGLTVLAGAGEKSCWRREILLTGLKEEKWCGSQRW